MKESMMHRSFLTLSFLFLAGCFRLDASGFFFRKYREDSPKKDAQSPTGQGSVKPTSIANQTPWGCCCYIRVWEEENVTIESSGCNCCNTFSLCCCAKKTVVGGDFGSKEVSILCCISRDMER